MQQSRYIIAYWLMLVSVASGQFPRACTDTQSLKLRECCPAGNDGSKCGESSNRGSCLDINPASIKLSTSKTASLLLDDRSMWPIAFYDRACVCNGSFDGVSCSKCKYGYEGENCNERSTLQIRRNFSSLSTDEVKKFIDILNRAKVQISQNYVILTTSFDRILQGEVPTFNNVSVYDIFVWMHYYAARDHFVFQNEDLKMIMQRQNVTLENRLQLIEGILSENTMFGIDTSADYAHEGSAFPPWHRYLMLKWEEEVRDVVAEDPSFALPYWDWRDKDVCDVCNDAMLGGQSLVNKTRLSNGSSFSKWEVICTKNNTYLKMGQLCTGEREGPLLRNPGNFDPNRITGLPTSAEVENILIMADEYDTPNFGISANRSYRNLLEGFANATTGIADPYTSTMHNAVHLYIGGTMSEVPPSANDPIFILHHVYIDSLFELWLRQQRKLNNTNLFNNTDNAHLGHRPQDFMVPFFPLVRNQDGFATSDEYGFVYDYICECENNGIHTDVVQIVAYAVVASVVVLVLLVLFVWWLKRRKR